MDDKPLKIYKFQKRHTLGLVASILAIASLTLLPPFSNVERVAVISFLLFLSGLLIVSTSNGRIELYEDRVCLKSFFARPNKCLALSEIGGVFEDHFLMWELESSHVYYLIPRKLLEEKNRLRRIVPAPLKKEHLWIDSGVSDYRDLLREIIKRLPPGAYIDPFVAWLLEKAPDRKWTRREIVEYYKQVEPGQLFH